MAVTVFSVMIDVSLSPLRFRKMSTSLEGPTLLVFAFDSFVVVVPADDSKTVPVYFCTCNVEAFVARKC